MEQSGEIAKLVINDAYIDDSGEFSCEVWNEAGQQNAAFKVTVKGEICQKAAQILTISVITFFF
jgi:hypothetical protein